MAQTKATKIALERDEYVCQYHKHILHHPIFIFDYREGFHSSMAGGHHLAGRARVDEPEMIIALCSECHTKAQTYIYPKIQMFALLSKIVGIDLYQKYRSMCKWNEDDWNKVYP
jgi:hypothetical protein